MLGISLLPEALAVTLYHKTGFDIIERLICKDKTNKTCQQQTHRCSNWIISEFLIVHVHDITVLQ